MAAPDLVNLAALIDDAKCFALVRQHRWPEGVRCPGCGSDAVVRHGRDDTQPQRQRYCRKACADRFDNLTGTVLAGRDRGARISGTDALTPTLVRAHAMRTDSGRPSSSIRFRARAAMATSTARPGSVRERNASPITRL